MRSTPSTPFDSLPGNLPSARVEKDEDVGHLFQRAKDAIASFSLDDLTIDCLWRDWLSVTSRVRTYCGAQEIVSTWHACLASTELFALEVFEPKVVRPLPDSSWVNVRVAFKTRQPDGLVGISLGILSYTLDDFGNWKIWMFATMLEHYAGHGHPDKWPAVGSLQPKESPRSGGYDAVVVGAGQAGLSTAGRLGSLGMKYVLLEKKDRVGFGWYGKYDSVTLHTTREYNNLPFGRLWGDDDPDRLPASKVVEGFQAYIDRYNINLWLSCVVQSCRWDGRQGVWTVAVASPGANVHTLRARNLILTMGAGHAIPVRPSWPGASCFRGELLHSSEYKNSSKWRGRKGVVIGSGTTAHDIAHDMVEAGLSSVTMIQRGKTAVWPYEWLEQGQKGVYLVILKSEEAMH